MADVANAIGRIAVQVASDLDENGFARVDILIESGSHGIKTVKRAVRREIERMSDFVEVAECDAGLRKTARDSADRKVARSLFPAEALFSGGSDTLPINQYSCTGGMSNG